MERREETWKLLAHKTFSKPAVMKQVVVVVVLMLVALWLSQRIFSS